jgi:hypothetical protein
MYDIKSNDNKEKKESIDDNWIIINNDTLDLSKTYNKCYENLMIVCSNNTSQNDILDNISKSEEIESDMRDLMDIEQEFNKIEYRMNTFTHYVDAFNMAAIENKTHICKYLYDKYDITTGKQKNTFSNRFNNFFATKAKLGTLNTETFKLGDNRSKINPQLFITCCERKCVDVALWMLYVDVFDINIIKIAIEKTMLAKCYYLCGYLYDIIKQNNSNDNYFIGNFIKLSIEKNIHETLTWFYNKDEHTFNMYIPYIFLDLCYYGRTNSMKWLMNIKRNNTHISDTLQPEYIYKGLINSCANDHTHILNILSSIYNYNYIISLIIQDQYRSVYTESIKYKAQGNLQWLNNIRSYNVKIEGLTSPQRANSKIIPDITNSDVISFSACSNQYNLVHCAEEIMKLIPKSFINCNVLMNNRYYVFTFDTLYYILYTSLSKIDIAHENIEVVLECKVFHNETKQIVKKIRVTIGVQSYITINELMDQIYKCESVKDKNIMAKLVINQLEINTNKQYIYSYGNTNPYTSLLIKILDIPTKCNVDSTIKVINDIECPICMGEQDMILNCGHSFCMSCAYLWYIKGDNKKICVVCQQNIDIKKSICIL